MKPSFASVATKPKWLGGLALAALVAIIFSLLMQWQLSRTFSYVGVAEAELPPVELAELAAPGFLEPGAYDRLATVMVTLDPENSFLVADRLQVAGEELTSGYWLISNSFVELESGTTSLTLALGFSESLEELQAARSTLESESYEITGYIEPAEPVKQVDQTEPQDLVGSVSLAQLVNLYDSGPVASYPIYLIVTEGLDLEVQKIQIDIRGEGVEINWLTAFYALEWAFFALVAFYLWWRLVQDERARLAT